jgi:ABC-2 type transport system ATP-binding protein
MMEPVALAEPAPPIENRARPHASAKPATDVVVRLEGIWRHWGRGSKRWAVLRDVNLELAAGSATLVSGRNGAGKTTLLRIATGILAPDQGTVTIDGLNCERHWREYHRRIGFLSAGDRGLYNRITVRGHLNFVAAQAFVPRAERRRAIADVLERFELAELAGRRSERLSQGQRQRLRLALTLVHRPKVLLLDEPRNSLDADGLGMLLGAVSEVRDRGGVVLWCAPAGEDQGFPFDRAFAIVDAGLVAQDAEVRR